MITLERTVAFSKVHRTSKQKGGMNTKSSPERIPRISRLMALAIRFDQMIQDGVVLDQAEIAKLGSVSRARMTQIMNLLCLAPRIQEQLLYITLLPHSINVIKEKHIRPLTHIADWGRQYIIWEKYFAEPTNEEYSGTR